MSLRWLATRNCHQMRLNIAIYFFEALSVSFAFIQCRIKPMLDESPFYSVNFSGADR